MIEQPEQLAARLLAGELSEAEAGQLRQRIDGDPAARAALARMQATVSALKRWPQSLPQCPVPATARWRRRQWRWLVPLAAAAGLLLAVGLAYHFGFREPASPQASRKGTPVDGGAAQPAKLHDEFAFLFSKDKAAPKTNEPKFGGPRGKGPDNGGGLLNGPKGHRGGKGGQALADKLRQQIDLPCRLPAELPGAHLLQDGAALSKQSVRLSYKGSKSTLVVHLKVSPGPDQAIDIVTSPSEPERKVFVTRRNGLGIALEGAGLERGFVEACVKEFLP